MKKFETYRDVVFWEDRTKDLSRNHRAIKLILAGHLNVMRLTSIRDNYPWLSEWAHEHLNNRGLEVCSEISNIRPDFMMLFLVFDNLHSGISLNAA